LLSGGQKQLLAICGVLIMRPEIIVFDEPTTLLDVRQAQAARGLERSLIASFVPVVILMLKMSEDIANALEARGFDA